MSGKARKRSRPVTDENRADCPFSITLLADPAQDVKDAQRAKKRKHDGQDEDRRVLVQNSPFKPAGKFKTYDSLNVCYQVQPRKDWLDMTRYNSFVLNSVKYFTDDFVYVANDRTVERQSQAHTAESATGKKSGDYWVARILEVRASDEHHVYARVSWMYWPDELPAGTIDGRKTVAGRQPYHGLHELVASNHMDVINVVSVAMAAKVRHWIETDDEEVHDALYWRQGFDSRTSQLSTVELVCQCSAPANPDKTLIGCTNGQCEKWMHYECLLDDVLTRVFESLGTDTPHETQVKEDKEDKTTPSSQNDTGGPATTSSGADTNTATPGSDQGSGYSSRLVAASKKPRRKKAGKRPYDGLFEATLRMNAGPTVWEISDLRSIADQGNKTWTEKAYCLVCDSVID